MRNLLILIKTLFLLITINDLSYSQESLESTYEKSIQTPTTSAISNYGDIPINMYTGAINYELPLHELSTTFSDILISINYGSSGIKIDEKAGVIGLGWSLNAGGVITRTSQSIPDDKYEKQILGGGYQDVPYLLRYQENISDAWDTYYEVASGNHSCDPGDSSTWDLKCKIYHQSVPNGGEKNVYDSQPDIFTYNFNNNSGKFLIPDTIPDNMTGEAVLLPNRNIKVEWFKNSDGSLEEFIITDEEGTRYYFNIVERVEERSAIKDSKSNVWQESEFEHRFNSSWYLSKIDSRVSNEEITFTYQNYEKTVVSPASGYYLGGDGIQELFVLSKKKSHFNSYLIDEITTENERIVFSYNEKDVLNGITLSDKTLKSIKIYNKSNGNHLKKKWDLLHDYFLSKNDLNSGSDLYYAEREAKLESIVLKGVGDSIDENVWHFDYINDMNNLLPYNYDITGYLGDPWYNYYSNNSLDYWGFYTGKDQSTSTSRGRLPELSSFENPGSGFDWLFTDMTPNGDALIGILNKITYPTGGFTEFNYEESDFSWVGEDDLHGVDLGLDFNLEANNSTTVINRTDESNLVKTTTFELDEEVSAYFESIIKHKFYSYERPCNYEPGHAINKLERIDNGVEEISYETVTMDNYDDVLDPNTGVTCEGIAQESERMFDPSGSNYDENIRLTLQPGTYRLTSILDCCDDNTNNILKEDVFVAEAKLHYEPVVNTENNSNFDSVTSFSQMVAQLNSQEQRENASFLEYKNNVGGGLRIKKVSSFSSENDEKPVVKKYIYKETEPSGEISDRSSGVLVRYPDYKDEILVNLLAGGDGNLYRIQSNNFLPLSTTHGSPIGYREVTEIYSDSVNSGKKRFLYNSPVEIPDYHKTIPANNLPTYHIIAATRDWARGNLIKEEIYNSEQQLIRSIDYEYDLDINTNQDKLFPGISLRTLDASLSDFDTENCGGTCKGNVSLYYVISDIYTTGTNNVKKITEKDFKYPDGMVSREKEHTYYTHSGITLPREIIEFNSNGEKRITDYKYAHEIYTDMEEKNMLSQPYSITIKDQSNQVLKKQWTLHQEYQGDWLPCGTWVWDGSMDGGEPKAPTSCSSN